jgi:transcriptional regulator with XRE-family HTH domain
MYPTIVENATPPSDNRRMLTKEQRLRVAQRVRAHRAHLGLNQTEFAKKMGIAVGTLQSIEANTRATRDENVEKIARGLKIPVDDLIRDEATVSSGDPLLKQLRREDFAVAHAYHHASSSTRRRVRATLRAFDDDIVVSLGPLNPLTDEQRAEITAEVKELLAKISKLPERAILSIRTFVDQLEAWQTEQREAEAAKPKHATRK